MDILLESKLKKYIYDFCNKYNLSQREIEIFYLVISNIFSHHQIAKLLGISANTVNNHLKNIISKVKVLNKTELLLKFSYFVFYKTIYYDILQTKKTILVLQDSPSVLIKSIKNNCQKILSQYDFCFCTVTNFEQIFSNIKKYLPRFLIINNISSLNLLRQLFESISNMNILKGIIIIQDNNILNSDDILEPSSMNIPCLTMEYRTRNYRSMHSSYLENLLFFILENDLESEFDRSRFKRIRLNIVAHINDLWNANIKNIGLGGAFLYCNKQDFNTITLYPNDILNIKFYLHKQAFNFEAQVVWRLDQDKIHKPSGIGIKFLNTQNSSQFSQFKNYIIKTKIAEFFNTYNS